MDAKPLSNMLLQQDSHTVSKYHPWRLINYKGEKGSLQQRNLVDATLTKWSNFITNDGTSWYHKSSDEGHNITCDNRCQRCLIESSHEESKSKFKDFLQNNRPGFFKNVSVKKGQERFGELFWIKRESRDKTTKCNVWSLAGSRIRKNEYKRHNWDNLGNLNMGYLLVNSKFLDGHKLCFCVFVLGATCWNT